ncbi:MAG: MaoC/PaaZ C-terminal domain-containing protein [Gammaproteobacteria bacterium]|nr:MaoC/PaaZ C-terminal domain-containing protein [Gammaproteobacteria bacterium]
MNDIRLTFNSMPSMVAIYPKLLLRSKPALVPDGASVPTIEARMDIVSTRPDKIVAYNKVCGFPDSDYLPITYPHVLAMPLHLQILSNEAFPARVMGLVHIENTITRYGLVPDQEILSIRCFIEGHTETDAGQLFAMNTVVSTRDSVVWEEVSTFLARRRGARKSGPVRKKTDAAFAGFDKPGTTSSGWNAPAGIGRHYAMVSGDINPNHLSSPTARLLGFPAAIAHGMWSLARSLAEIGEKSLGPQVRVCSKFKLPILLPARVTFLSHSDERGTDFLLADHAGQKPHLTGLCTKLLA